MDRSHDNSGGSKTNIPIINVLSVFDGYSSGQIALDRLNIKANYYSSEIDKYALSVTKANYSNTNFLGDVLDVKSSNLPKIDLLMGGSPCQGFSFIGKGLNFEDSRSALFFEYVRLLDECKPEHFILENVKMSGENRDIISRYLGCDPVAINSSLFTAQNRVRYYWTNIPVKKIYPKDIYIDDIIDHSDNTERVISKNLDRYVPKSRPLYCDPYNKKEITKKSTTLRTNVNNGNMWIRVNNGYRNLTVRECELLQGVDVGYMKGVTNSQAKKLLGNGWTIPVIEHILEGLLQDERS